MAVAVRLPAVAVLALAGVVPVVRAGEIVSREPPIYSAASIVNAANSLPGPLSPNCIATIYGKNLAWTTRALLSEDIRGGQELPTVLAGTGVRVTFGDILANVYFVSPAQINFLVPPNLKPGNHRVYVSLDGLAGPEVTVRLLEASPGLFQTSDSAVVATHSSGELIVAENPARPGETIVIYAAGLGPTSPRQKYGFLVKTPAQIDHITDLQLTAGGMPVPLDQVDYAGVTPGFAGLYQINLRLPDGVPENPDMRVWIGEQASPEGVRLPLVR
jgi:uncharacterized protein (TIGR03437 family)